MRSSALLLLALATGSLAAADNVRLDIDALKEGITLDDPAVAVGSGSVSYAKWIKDEAKAACFVAANFRIPARTWTQVGVTFTPATDGKLIVQLRGPHKSGPDKKLIPVLVRWDAVSAEGAKVNNGSFETLSDKRPECPAGWWFSSKATEAKLITEEGAAKDGANAFQTWHSESLMQTIAVTAGQPVTITAWAWSEVDPGAAGKSKAK